MAVRQSAEPRSGATTSRLSLGAIALILAVAVIAIFRVAGRLISLVAPGIFTTSAVAGGGWFIWTESVCMAVALALGVVALATRRGRGYAIAAVVLAIFGSEVVAEAVLAVFPPYRYG